MRDAATLPEIAPRSAAAPYATLTPDRILDALDARGCRAATGACWRSTATRIASTSSTRDEEPRRSSSSSTGPARWTDAQIVEEHAFVAELVEREIPAVAPLAIDGAHAA